MLHLHAVRVRQSISAMRNLQADCVHGVCREDAQLLSSVRSRRPDQEHGMRLVPGAGKECLMRLACCRSARVLQLFSHHGVPVQDLRRRHCAGRDRRFYRHGAQRGRVLLCMQRDHLRAVRGWRRVCMLWCQGVRISRMCLPMLCVPWLREALPWAPRRVYGCRLRRRRFILGTPPMATLLLRGRYVVYFAFVLLSDLILTHTES